MSKATFKGIAVILLFGGLLGVMYREALVYLYGQWNEEDFSYCFLVPMVVAYLAWEKRQAWQSAPTRRSWIGFLPLAAGLMLFMVGELGGEFFTLNLSLWLVVAGLLWIHFGWAKLRTVGFALLLSLALFPPPDAVVFPLSLQLKLISSQMGVEILQAMGMTAFREGNVIDLGFTRLQVVDACSGLRYFFPILILGLLLAYFFRAPIWKRGVLVLSAIPLVILANGIRIAATGYLYQFWGQRVAEGFFHDFAGWFTFVFALGVLLPQMWLLKKIPSSWMPSERSQPEACGHEIVSGSWQRSASAALMVGLVLLFSQQVDFREATPPKKDLTRFPLEVESWHGERRPMEQMFVDALKFTDYALIDFADGTGRTVNFYLAYYDSQQKGRSIHSPATCLPGGGWEFKNSGLVTLGQGEDGFQVNRAVIEKDGVQQLSYFWFPQRGRVLTNAYELKIYGFWDALTRQRTDGALVRLITPVGKGEPVEAADARLQEIARSLVPVLDEFLPGREG